MNLSPLPIQKFFDNNGRPLVGGQLFTYAAGTTTKIASYSDDGGTLNTNPVVLDFRGEARVWLDSELTYKFVLAPADDTDPPANPIWTVDNISPNITVAELTNQFLGKILWPRTAAEISAGITPTNYYYEPGVLARYGGFVAASAATNTAALQAALDCNQLVRATEDGTYNFNDTIIYNRDNRIVGNGLATIFKWNVTGQSLIVGLNVATARIFGFCIENLTIDGTNRANAGVIGLDLDNLSLGYFSNVIVKNCETGIKFWSSRGDGLIDGCYYNTLVGVSVLTVDDGLVFAALANENELVACRVGECANGVIGDDGSSNMFNRISIEQFTNIAVDIGATAPALYYTFIKPRIEDGPTGFRLDNADARSTTIVAPHFQTCTVANIDPAAIGLDTLILSGEMNSPELRTNILALGQGALDNAQWAIIKANAASDVYIRNASDAGFADLTASDLYANRYVRVRGASSGAASTTTIGNGTATTIGANGAASALTALPLGYILVHVGTTAVQIPYYNRA
jgi:hypothetical protein